MPSALCADIGDVAAPPRLWIARRATVGCAEARVRVGVTRVHGELDEVRRRRDHPLELLPVLGQRPEHASVGVEPDPRSPPLGVLDDPTMCGWTMGSPPPVMRIQAP